MTGSAPSVAIVLGTYNRLELLRDAVTSIRDAVGEEIPYEIVLVDGGSSDGSQAWARDQEDIHLIEQHGPLTGAVKAFNMGFGYAVEQRHEYVMHLNDDAQIVTPRAIALAIEMMEKDDLLGAVAFAFDLRGSYNWEYIHGFPYINFGLIRTQAGKDVAVAQGDATGRDWWNPIYRTYGADSEFGCWLHQLGWKVCCSDELRVHDRTKETWNDELRALNGSDDPGRTDSTVFWSRWPYRESIFTGPVTG